jgi:hypothetical protein
LPKGFTGSPNGSVLLTLDCGVWGGEALPVKLRDPAAATPRVAPAPTPPAARAVIEVRSGANCVTGRTLSCGGADGVIGWGFGGGPGGGILSAP